MFYVDIQKRVRGTYGDMMIIEKKFIDSMGIFSHVARIKEHGMAGSLN